MRQQDIQDEAVATLRRPNPTSLKDRHVTAINVQVRPADNDQALDELNAAATDDRGTAVRIWEMPVSQQGLAKPWPQKRQGEASMRREARYGDYLFPEQIVQLERRESRERQAAQRMENARAKRELQEARADKFEPGAILVQLDGTVLQANAQGKLVKLKGPKPAPATRKPRKTKAEREEEAEAQIARLMIPNARPFRSDKNRIGRAR